jgi:hypothetical protein
MPAATGGSESASRFRPDLFPYSFVLTHLFDASRTCRQASAVEESGAKNVTPIAAPWTSCGDVHRRWRLCQIMMSSG